jgi:hypothetical protein
VSPFQFQLHLTDNSRRSPVAAGRAPSFPSETLAPGACTRGWVSFELQPGEQPAEITWATARAGQELEAEWTISDQKGH